MGHVTTFLFAIGQFLGEMLVKLLHIWLVGTFLERDRGIVITLMLASGQFLGER